MALTGELSDLSLAELIEFFCNQRKTGRLKVIYSIGPGYFYLQAGSVVHARIGALRGIEAVYCALTLPNASFTFSPAFEPPEHSINQPWTAVVLEGLRRMDEGISPSNPFPEEAAEPVEELKTVEPELTVSEPDEPGQDDDESKNAVINVPVAQPAEMPAFLAQPAEMPAFLAQAENKSRWRDKPWTLGAIVFAVVLVLTVIGVPWGMYARKKAAKLATESQTVPATNPESSAPSVETSAAPTPDQTVVPAANSADAEQFAKRQREDRARERARAQATANAAFTGSPLPEAKNTPVTANPSSLKPQSSPSAAGRKVTVQVTYDENGRVTQASGGDATALRIARQKRFPAGKAGSATVTIPIN
jgi:hypothetical protein